MAKKNCGNSIANVRKVADSIGVRINATRKGKSVITVQTESVESMYLFAQALRLQFINISISDANKTIGIIN